MLFMLAPPISSCRAAYYFYINQHGAVMTKSFIGQKENRTTTTFDQLNVTTMEHVVTTVTNADMLSRYLFKYNHHKVKEMMLQTLL